MVRKLADSLAAKSIGEIDEKQMLMGEEILVKENSPLLYQVGEIEDMNYD